MYPTLGYYREAIHSLLHLSFNLLSCKIKYKELLQFFSQYLLQAVGNVLNRGRSYACVCVSLVTSIKTIRRSYLYWTGTWPDTIQICHCIIK